MLFGGPGAADVFSEYFRDSNEITLFILDGISMHEVLMTGNPIQYTSLLFGTAKTLEFDSPDPGFKLFMKDELDDFQAAGFKIDGTFYPKFNFIIQPKTSLLGIMTNKIRFAV